MNPTEDFSNCIEEAIKHPKNLGELDGADAVGTVGSEDCGDMLRMWVKFKEVDGKRVIDKATFQTFGCETAIAVASVATELINWHRKHGNLNEREQRVTDRLVELAGIYLASPTAARLAELQTAAETTEK